MQRINKWGPKYKLETVCVFQMNWAMCRNNKISLCCGDSKMAIIQQCSHFRQRTFSYIMHSNHCIFPPFWATMHISSSQWNIKHSYDLIFSFKGDFGLYIFCTSLASPRGPKFRGMSLFGQFVYWRRVWLVIAGVWINNSTNQSQRLSRLWGHWSVRALQAVNRRLGSFQFIWLKFVQDCAPSLPAPCPDIPKVNCYPGDEIDWKLVEVEEEMHEGVVIQKLKRLKVYLSPLSHT